MSNDRAFWFLFRPAMELGHIRANFRAIEHKHNAPMGTLHQKMLKNSRIVV